MEMIKVIVVFLTLTQFSSAAQELEDASSMLYLKEIANFSEETILGSITLSFRFLEVIRELDDYLVNATRLIQDYHRITGGDVRREDHQIRRLRITLAGYRPLLKTAADDITSTLINNVTDYENVKEVIRQDHRVKRLASPAAEMAMNVFQGIWKLELTN